jgi:hypothetical protein
MRQVHLFPARWKGPGGIRQKTAISEKTLDEGVAMMRSSHERREGIECGGDKTLMPLVQSRP